VAVLTRLQTPFVSSVPRIVARALLLPILSLLVFAGGCKRFHYEKHDMVYVVRHTYLHDRVAAVSNRVGEVVNGQPLEVLERGRRFLKVKTEKNEVGWIEDRAVIDSASYDEFSKLESQHKQDPVVATGTLRDEVYLHVSPGRNTDRFYLLPENDKVQLLVRASVPKSAPGPEPAKTPTPAGKPALAKPALVKPPAPKPAVVAPASAEPESPVIPMEDWWLIRDSEGHSGWLLAGKIDVDVPDEIGQYAEGQRIVGAYVIAKVTDSEANTPNHQVPEYVTALSPVKYGLPYDFDQVRVFTWSLKHHRYETAFRIHPIQGYLPVRITSQPGPGGTEPVFSFQISTSPDVAIDPNTGIARPLNPRTVSFAMRDTQVRRTGPDMAPIPTMHLPGEKPTKAEKKKKR
jgi:hypothetical protein